MGLPERPLVVHVVHSLEGGGTERVLLRLLRAFNHQLARHAVVTLRKAGNLAAELPDEVACVALETSGRDRGNGVRLGRVIRRLQPAIVHARNTCTWADATIARLFYRGARLVLGFHGRQDGGAFTPRDRIATRAARLLGAEFTSVSQFGANQLAVELGIAPNRICVIPNGVESDTLQSQARTALRECLGIATGEYVVGTVGSLIPIKDHDLLFHAIAKASGERQKLRLVVVGDGPLRESLEQLAVRLGIRDRVFFAGARTDVADLLAAIDLYVCSSRSEGMSNALMEAMAAGRPVVSTDVGDHGVVIREGLDGSVVPPGDSDALAAAIGRIISRPAIHAFMGQSARERMMEYGFNRTVAAYERLYQRLAVSHPSVRSHAIVGQCQKVSPIASHLAAALTHH